jgi:hypothetical protein
MPAKAGIQKYPVVTKALDPGACPGHRSGVRRGDDSYGWFSKEFYFEAERTMILEEHI